jgi:ABC-type uncharacterized transport system auxiliary subunit
MRVKTAAIIAALTVWLSACSVLPKPAPPPKRHDFGPPPTARRAQSPLPGRVQLAGVNAASWLNGTAIYYRRLNAAPTRLRRYALNEWLVPPAELIAARLDGAFDRVNAKAPNPPRYRLDLRLVALEQIFSDPRQAHEFLRVEAALGGGGVSAHKVFTVTRKTSPTIGGAVKGTAAAVDRLAAKLIGWIRARTARQR